MGESANSWSGAMRGVAESFLDLLRAEASELGRDLARSRRLVVRILILVAIAACFLFWAIAVLLLAAVEGLSLVWPRWAAALAVAAVLLVVIAGLGLAARATARRLESPANTVRRRIDDHVQWWNESLASDRGRLEGEGDATEERG